MSETASPRAVRRIVPFVLLAALALAPLAAALRFGGPRTLAIDLGPGDGRFVSGFVPEWEVDEKVGTHWTTYDARVALPLEVRGPLRLTMRYSRVLPQTAVVDVTVAGRPVPRFTARGGAWEERAFDLAPAGDAAAHVGVRVDSHDRRNLGLKLDWMRLEAGGARLTGVARVRPALAVALLAALLVALGWPIARAAAIAAPLALALTGLLLRDAWLAHRLLAGLPEMLALGLAVALVVRFRGGLGATLRLASTVAVLAFVVRAAALNHPSFYYPDLLVHARLCEIVREAGPDFLRRPSTYIWGAPGTVDAGGRGPSGLWLKDIGGRAYGLPYSLAFHAPFAPFAATLDQRIGWLKLWGAAVSILPILAAGALAKRWGLPSVSLVAMAFVPTYLSRLSLGLLPALFGHAVEMAFLAWIAARSGPLARRTIVVGALFLAACQLAYVSTCASLLVIALGGAAWRAKDGVRARGLAAMLVAASVLSIAVYYRDFLTPWLAGSGGGPGGIRGAGSGSGFENPLLRLVGVFGVAFVAAALGGAVALWRSGATRAVVAAWALVGTVLLAARSLVPIMRFSHEELWLAPLVCLAAGQAIAWLWARQRALAMVLAVALAAEGLWLQWRALSAQLCNAL